jgi:hypothetical protein
MPYVATTLSSLSAPRMTIFQRVVRQGPLQRLRLIPWRVHPDVRSSSVVEITGIAFGWIGSTTAFGEVVRKP